MEITPLTIYLIARLDVIFALCVIAIIGSVTIMTIMLTEESLLIIETILSNTSIMRLMHNTIISHS